MKDFKNSVNCVLLKCVYTLFFNEKYVIDALAKSSLPRRLNNLKNCALFTKQNTISLNSF